MLVGCDRSASGLEIDRGRQRPRRGPGPSQAVRKLGRSVETLRRAVDLLARLGDRRLGRDLGLLGHLGDHVRVHARRTVVF